MRQEHAREVERLNEMLAEIQMNGHQWMVAYDRLKAGKLYDLPKPADLPEALTVMREALTPSAETKAAYIGEFSFNIADHDTLGNEISRKVDVPWTTIKEIMAAIRDYAKLSHGSVVPNE